MNNGLDDDATLTKNFEKQKLEATNCKHFKIVRKPLDDS